MYQTEHYVTLTDFPMPQLERKRQIRLFLPTGYFDSNQNYPVLYMHDGQNVFLIITRHTVKVGEQEKH
ncbi:TPA: alpha/beta hydrolase-fold protein [Vibrio cholerae]|uniref:alpha/beta hydrolase-fold protein n=2 Tax=Vibrio cholerae TaxID=666 RepID=UPI002934C9BF|nr:alpha/beta hydrolase-fold protein [Vibrio cholerae]